jgi:hypothetical protein
MTLDDLVEVYFKAWFEFTRNNKDFLPNESERNRACIRAVVEALREAVVLKIDAHNGCGILATETAIDATRDVFNEILAKAEHSDADRDGVEPPAAAPDVCEWKRIALSNHYITGHGNRRYWDATCTMECGECHRPIKFKEGSE